MPLFDEAWRCQRELHSALAKNDRLADMLSRKALALAASNKIQNELVDDNTRYKAEIKEMRAAMEMLAKMEEAGPRVDPVTRVEQAIQAADTERLL